MKRAESIKKGTHGKWKIHFVSPYSFYCIEFRKTDAKLFHLFFSIPFDGMFHEIPRAGVMLDKMHYKEIIGFSISVFVFTENRNQFFYLSFRAVNVNKPGPLNLHERKANA